MEELDDLLRGLGNPSSNDDTNTINMKELDELMSGLNDGARSAPKAQPKQAQSDDLDDLLSGLSDAPKPAASTTRAPAKAAAAPVAAPVKAAPAKQPAAAKVATEDLDDLLEGLDAPLPEKASQPAPRTSTTPVRSSGNPTNAGSKTSGSDVDAMFNSINASSRAPPPQQQQLKPAPSNSGPLRGTCAGCNQQIHGEVLQSMNKLWHPEHFVCGNCHTELGFSQFFEYEGMPHCEKCYKGLFCPRCAKCDLSITDRIITALNKKWHPDCFVCSTCTQPFPGGSFFERDGYPYCSDHFYTSSVPNCGSCNKPVRGECTNALNQAWHVECFVCQYCRKAFTDGAFFEHQGKPYCKLHYHANTGSVCGGCQKAITGRSVNAMGKNWHPEHFVCAFCVNPLGGGNYTEKQGKPYCAECHANLFT